MLSCETCRRQMLDFGYGLLEPAEAEAFTAHIAGCPACAAQQARIEHQRDLLAQAARASFPEAQFHAPAAASATSTPETVTAPTAPASTPHRTVASVWARWAVAASLLLAFAGLGGPALRDMGGYLWFKPAVNRDLAAVDAAQSDQARLTREIQQANTQLALAVHEAKSKHDATVEAWVSAEKTAIETAATRPFLVSVQGPSTALPGAPNDYLIRVTEKRSGKAKAVGLSAQVRSTDGRVVFEQGYDADAKPRTLRLPADLWSKVPTGEDLQLTLTAIDPTDGGKTQVRETIQLQEPLYATFLVVDKPMYRPGESVFFRSLTLDRTRFLPPTREMNLHFELKAPSGQPVPGMVLEGLAKPAADDEMHFGGPNAQPTLLRGPDQKPIRGIGTGRFDLPADLAGGEYTLLVREIPMNGTPTRSSRKPLATHKFLVNNYTPDLLEKKLEFDAKTYGPGDPVQAKLEVRDQSKPVPNAKLTYTINVDGEPVTPDIAPLQPDAEGNAAIRFTLPKKEELLHASLTVTVRTDAVVEAITRPIPMASRRLTMEFFPEGGDLIAGTPNRVYFRATTNTGKPADIKGTLTDGIRDLASVQTLTDPDHPGANQGMGAFTFTPEAGVHYAVKLDTPIGIIPPVAWETPTKPILFGIAPKVDFLGYRLPEAKKTGVVLHVPDEVTQPGEPIRLQLHSAGVGRTLSVGAYIRGRAVAGSTVIVKADSTADLTLNLGSTKLGGVTRITVFEHPEVAEGHADLKPVAERLVFREPGESLKLSYTAKKAGSDKAVSSFIPGNRVQLDITAKNELDQPVAAILMAAVVNQSIITMADDKTARLMPTHFLLAGEIEHPEELEHADFLLTDHPKAHEAIDLLLGTQGWRRFAEQAPVEFFRKFRGGEADHLIVAAADGPVPQSWTTDARKVFDEFWPRYEAAILNLEAAEQHQKSGTGTGDLRQDLLQANSAYSASLTALGESGRTLRFFDDNMNQRRRWLPASLLLLCGLAAVLLVLRVKQPAKAVGNRTLTGGAVGFVCLGLFLIATVLLTVSGNTRWRSVASHAPNWEDRGPRGYRNMPMTTATAAAPMAAARAPVNDGALEAELPHMEIPEGGMAQNAAKPQAFGAADMVKPDAALPEPPAAPGAAVKPDAALPEPPAAPGNAIPAAPEGAVPLPAPAVAKAVPPGIRVKGMAVERFAAGEDKGFQGRNALRKMEKQQVEMAPARKNAEMKDLAAPLDFVPPPGNGMARRGDLALRGQLRGLQFGQAGRLAVELQNDFAKKRAAMNLSKDRDEAVSYLTQAQAFIRNSLPTALPLTVREYAHARATPPLGMEGVRADFTETLLWQPVLVTPESGTVSVSFDLSDSVNGYQVLIAGHTLNGRIGATKGTIEVRKPFAIDPKLPHEISSGDKLLAPLVLTNGTDTPQTADITLSLGGLTSDRKQFTSEMSANGGSREFLQLLPSKLEGPVSVKLRASAGGNLSDSIERRLTVVPEGFPLEGAKSGMLEQITKVPVNLPKTWVPGTLKVAVTVYPNTLSELQAGLDGLMREPYGCFEQSSTANYPNVLIMGYLNETNQAKPDVAKRARELMDRGYARLTGYECPRTGSDTPKGFEWFGAKDRPHESLTAYGLLQFTDMSAVYPVSDTMLSRTKEFLLNSRDGKGGFKRNSRHLDTFGGAPEHITNAYIVWAVTESERAGKETPADLTRELQSLTTLARSTDHPAAKDPYFLALVANSLMNRNRTDEAITLLQTIAKMQAADGSIPGAATSITSSSGRDLLVETTAFGLLGFLKANRADLFLNPTRNAMKWIGSQRSGSGSFGSTQATIMSLKALIEFARANKRPAESGTLRVLLDGKEIGTKSINTDIPGPIVLEFPDADGTFKPGETSLRIESTTKEAYPMSVAWSCRTTTPNSSPDCAVTLQTRLAKSDVTEGEAVRLDATITNTRETAHGMTIAIIGIPAGLKLPEDMKQLKKLTEPPTDGSEPTISYWETRGRELILYWRGMTPKQSVSFSLDLIANIPGEYRGPASRAYLYYNADHKQWVEPLGVTIRSRPAP